MFESRHVITAAYLFHQSATSNKKSRLK